MIPHSFLSAPMLRPMLLRTYTSYTTQLQLQLAQISKTRFGVPVISTLDPKKFLHSDFLVVAGTGQPSFHTQLSLRSQAKHGHSQPLLTYQSYGLGGTKNNVDSESDGATSNASQVVRKVRGRLIHLPFPVHSQGFLYLHQPQPEFGISRLASSIRFRCTPSLVEASASYIASLGPIERLSSRSEPLICLPPSLTNSEIYEAFKTGFDLTLPDGIPWSIPIVSAAGRPALKYLRLQLLQDKIFSKSELQEFEEIYENRKLKRGDNLLHTLDDVFPIRFDSTSLTVWVATTKGKILDRRKKKASQTIPESSEPRIEYKLLSFRNLFADRRSKYGDRLPYTGAAHVHFELTPGNRQPTLSLRIVKITESVKCVIPDYDGHVHMPKEGKFLARGSPGKPKLWRSGLSFKLRSSILALAHDYAADAHLC